MEVITEPILYGWKDGGQHYWCGARDQGDVWQIAKLRANDLHPTMKPVELVERAIGNSSRRGDVVLDPFGGSGKTLIASEPLGWMIPGVSYLGARPLTRSASGLANAVCSREV